MDFAPAQNLHKNIISKVGHGVVEVINPWLDFETTFSS